MMDEKVKNAHANGYKKGYYRGYIDGQRYFAVAFAKDYERILKRLKNAIKENRPLPTYCWSCFTEIERCGCGQPKKKKSRKAV